MKDLQGKEKNAIVLCSILKKAFVLFLFDKLANPLLYLLTDQD